MYQRHIITRRNIKKILIDNDHCDSVTMTMKVMTNTLRTTLTMTTTTTLVRRTRTTILMGTMMITLIRAMVRSSVNMGVSKNNGTPKSSILIGFSIINHPFWGVFPLQVFLETPRFILSLFKVYFS